MTGRSSSRKTYVCVSLSLKVVCTPLISEYRQPDDQCEWHQRPIHQLSQTCLPFSTHTDNLVACAHGMSDLFGITKVLFTMTGRCWRDSTEILFHGLPDRRQCAAVFTFFFLVDGVSSGPIHFRCSSYT